MARARCSPVTPAAKRVRPPLKRLKRLKRATKLAPAGNGGAVDAQRILAVDIGGTNVKLLVSGEQEARRLASGRAFTPAKLVEAVQDSAQDWAFDAVSIGYPGQVGPHGPRSEPGNLGPGWVGFDFAAAFGRPVRFLNDAAMQALGSYDGGRMLFLGLGTGLGSTLITENIIVPLELGQLRWERNRVLSDFVGKRGLERLGKRAWRKTIEEMVARLALAFNVDYVVLGGGNAKYVNDLPPNTRLGHNLTAFRGGFRLWHIDDVQTLSAGTAATAIPPAASAPTEWKVL